MAQDGGHTVVAESSDAMPGADAGVLVMVHAGREYASAIGQLQSVATSRGRFSGKRTKWFGTNQNRRGVGGVWGRRRVGGPVGVADPLR